MNLLPGLQSVLDELTHRFGTQIEEARAPQPNELYLHTKLELAGAFCSALYKKHDARLAGLFAEDARADHHVFFVYYLYALDAAQGFILVRVPVPPEQPELPSLTNAVHAVNWQEREIQDLFGIKLIGHPNPEPLRAARRLAGSLAAAQRLRGARALASLRRAAPQVPPGRRRGGVPGAGWPRPRGHH